MPTKKTQKRNLTDPAHIIDRELSWLAFNDRVIEEAEDQSNPLLERLRFLGIASSNLDEFFMVRVSGVQEQLNANVKLPNPAGLSPAEHFKLIHEYIHRQVARQYSCLTEKVLPLLESEGIRLRRVGELSSSQRRFAREFFDSQVFPVLTPLAVDSGHPFPHLRNLSLNLAVRLQASRGGKNAERLFAIVQVPSVLDRLVRLPSQGKNSWEFVLLEDLISAEIRLLFPGMRISEVCAFRLTRDADIDYEEEEADDLLKTVEAELRLRERGSAVRLGLESRASAELCELLRSIIGLEPIQIYHMNGPINLAEVAQIASIVDRPDLKYDSFTPSIRGPLKNADNIFEAIAEDDILLHHPYESFTPVVDFIEQAAEDPNVLAIKQTLYRTSGDSSIIKALMRAAEKGKQVAALVELKARFDEERNISWARQMERAGVHVVYGLVGLKTHAKICLVVRKESGGIRRYVHLSTGNYNPITARVYTDLSLFTCDNELCDDASELFNLLTGYSRMPEWKKMIVAPIRMRQSIIEFIEGETAKAKAGKPARIRAKMNSLVDVEIIGKLYEASCAGVPIDLMIRGICCLKPGLKGVSENIRVSSIVDRFLEHSRIYIFGEGDEERVYLSSADWMPRNLDRRVEALFPIEAPELSRRVIEEVFSISMRDNVKRRSLGSDGKYTRVTRRGSEPALQAQKALLEVEKDLKEKNKIHRAHDDLVPRPPEEKHPIKPPAPIKPAARHIKIPAGSPIVEIHNAPPPENVGDGRHGNSSGGQTSSA